MQAMVILEGEAARLAKRPVTFMRLTGLPVARFFDLVEAVTPLLVQANVKRLSRRERRRAVGGGKRYDLPVCERLLMTLTYYRTYISQEFLGSLFDMDASNVCRNMKIIRLVLAQIFRIPERRIVMTPEAVTTRFLTAPNSGSTGRKAA
jgi:hypothetical protein